MIMLTPLVEKYFEQFDQFCEIFNAQAELYGFAEGDWMNDLFKSELNQNLHAMKKEFDQEDWQTYYAYLGRPTGTELQKLLAAKKVESKPYDGPIEFGEPKFGRDLGVQKWHDVVEAWAKK